MYSMDMNDTYPKYWSDLTVYANNPKLFFCKTRGGQIPESCAGVDIWAHFVYLPGRTPHDPPETLLAYEPLSNHRGQGGNLLFVDGSVMWADAALHTAILHTGRLPPESVR